MLAFDDASSNGGNGFGDTGSRTGAITSTRRLMQLAASHVAIEIKNDVRITDRCYFCHNVKQLL